MNLVVVLNRQVGTVQAVIAYETIKKSTNSASMVTKIAGLCLHNRHYLEGLDPLEQQSALLWF